MAAVLAILRLPRHRRDRLAWVGLLALVLFGVGLRLAYQQAAFERDPLQGAPYLDSGAYDEYAAEVLEHGPFPPEAFYKPPGYTWLLAALYGLGAGARGVAAFQALLDGATALMLAGLAWSLFRRRGAALAAACLYLVDPVTVYFSGERLETSWALFWVVLHLAALFGAVGGAGAPGLGGVDGIDSGGAVRGPARWTRWGLAGLTAGFAALVRPNLLLWLPVLAVAAWRRRGWPAAVAALAGALLLLAPVLFQNQAHGGGFAVAANGGVNLWLGNVPDPQIQGRIPYYEHLPGPVAGWLWDQAHRPAADAGAVSAGEQSAEFVRTTLQQAVGEKPLRTLKLLAFKTVALCNRVDLSNNRDLYREGSPLAIPGAWVFSWAILMPLALTGLWILRRTRNPRWRWLMLFAGVTALSVLLFFVSGRHRAPLIPPMILLALPTLQVLLRFRRWKEVDSQVVVLLMVTSFFVTHDWFGHRELYAGYEIDPVGVGNQWMALGRPVEAEAAFQRALTRIPEDPLAQGNLAALRVRQGRLDEAEALLRASIGTDEDRPDTQNRLGLVLLLQERPQDALPCFARALELAPAYAIAWMNQGRALSALGRRDEARRSLQRALELLGPDHPDAVPTRRLLQELGGS